MIVLGNGNEAPSELTVHLIVNVKARFDAIHIAMVLITANMVHAMAERTRVGAGVTCREK